MTSTSTRPRTDVGAAPGRPAREARALALTTALVGVGAVAVALLGPLGAGVIEYHVSAGATDQVRGGDVAGLLLVGPLALVAAALAWRGRPGGEALAVAPAAYGLYLYTQLAISGDPGRYPGTSERWFPLFWALVTLCGASLVLAGVRLARLRPPPARPRLERVAGWYLVAVAAFLTVGLHLPGLRAAWQQPPASAEYLADPGLFWVVKTMDLAFVVPAVLAVGIGLLTGRAWARTLLAPVAGWCALLGSSVAGMGVAMVVAGSAGASVGLAGGFAVAAALALALAGAAYRPLVRPGGRRGHAR